MRASSWGVLKVVWLSFLLLLVAGFGYFLVLPGVKYSITAIDPNKLEGDYDVSDQQGEFYGSRVTSTMVPEQRLAAVLGQTSEPKRIEVDLTNQKVYAFEGDRKVYEFLVSTGKWGRTPTGNFRIWSKSRYQKMSGGNRALGTYYYLPNIPFIMWFAGDGVSPARGFSLHGTYWHSNFGYPMSHGCVNMRTEDAGTLFYWSDPVVSEGNVAKATETNPGTPVIVYGETPWE